MGFHSLRDHLQMQGMGQGYDVVLAELGRAFREGGSRVANWFA
jgi:hypothetical protein